MEKKKLTPAELSAIRSAAAKKVKTRHGRPKGCLNKKPAAGRLFLTRSLTVREDDYILFSRLAHLSDHTIVDFMHMVAESLRIRNASILTTPPAPPSIAT